MGERRGAVNDFEDENVRERSPRVVIDVKARRP